MSLQSLQTAALAAASEGAERTQLLGRHQAVVGMLRVREALALDWAECPEVYVGEDTVMMYSSQSANAKFTRPKGRAFSQRWRSCWAETILAMRFHPCTEASYQNCTIWLCSAVREGLFTSPMLFTSFHPFDRNWWPCPLGHL
jgi:hypothetical protein